MLLWIIIFKKSYDTLSPVQEIISKMWFGGLEPEGRLGPFICSLFFPPVAPLLLQPTSDIHIDFDAPYFSLKTTCKEWLIYFLSFV